MDSDRPGGNKLRRAGHVPQINLWHIASVFVHHGRLKSVPMLDSVAVNFPSSTTNGDIFFGRVSPPSITCPRISFVGEFTTDGKVMVNLP
jgi:hypothetical protein